jgi:hypothetical protein
MAQLELIRDNGHPDRYRAYSIMLDGDKVCEIRRGQTKLIPISPGAHSVMARIDWGGSGALQFSATPEETVALRVTSNCLGWRVLLLFWYAFADWNSYLKLERLKTSYGDGALGRD